MESTAPRNHDWKTRGDTNPMRKQQILDFIRKYRKKNGISPTLKEISLHIYDHAAGMGNLSTKYIKPLIEEGFLKHAASTGGRTLVLTDPQPRKVYYKRTKEFKK